MTTLQQVLVCLFYERHQNRKWIADITLSETIISHFPNLELESTTLNINTHLRKLLKISNVILHNNTKISVTTNYKYMSISEDIKKKVTFYWSTTTDMSPTKLNNDE